MQGTILNYRRGRTTQHTNQYIIEVNEDKYNTKEAVAELYGKKVIFKTIGGKEITGKVSSAHGNKGALRVIFEKGLPGEAVGQKVEIK